jgi:hypothetical protein
MSFGCSVLLVLVAAEPQAAIAAVVPFCALENRSEMREKQVFLEKCTANSGAKVFLFAPGNKCAADCKLLKRFGVPDGIRPVLSP